jgi:hypothetical protein
VSATFIVKLGPGGSITSVSVGAINGGNASMWNAIASSAKGAIAARKLNLTEDYKKGAVVTVNAAKSCLRRRVSAGLKLSSRKASTSPTLARASPRDHCPVQRRACKVAGESHRSALVSEAPAAT